METPSRTNQLRLPHSAAALTSDTPSAPLLSDSDSQTSRSCPFKHGANVPPARTPPTSRSDRDDE